MLINIILFAKIYIKNCKMKFKENNLHDYNIYLICDYK